MPVYEFKCKECDVRVDLTSNRPTQRCESCGGALKRVWSCTFPQREATFQPHYNYCVGDIVSSWSEFSDKLKRRGEANTEITGIEHSYTPISAADMRDLPGTTSEGLDSPRYDPNLTSKRTFT